MPAASVIADAAGCFGFQFSGYANKINKYANKVNK